MRTDTIKEKVLQSLENEFVTANTAAIYLKASETQGLASDVLTALLDGIGADADEVAVEMSFLPDGGESDLLYFVCGFLFSENLDEVFVSRVREVIARANYYIPTGAFSCENGTLMLRMNTTLPADIPQDKIEEACRAVVASGIQLTNLYVRPLLRLSEGAMSIEDVCADLF